MLCLRWDQTCFLKPARSTRLLSGWSRSGLSLSRTLASSLPRSSSMTSRSSGGSSAPFLSLSACLKAASGSPRPAPSSGSSAPLLSLPASLKAESGSTRPSPSWTGPSRAPWGLRSAPFPAVPVAAPPPPSVTRHASVANLMPCFSTAAGLCATAPWANKASGAGAHTPSLRLACGHLPCAPAARQRQSASPYRLRQPRL
mmetsp:Transcript_20796/g.58344  ORF Transcript_20796/g.58344 Transcript_20796/m.58344 type:complete len:200 (+) Transcript_20796:483-1082(+)